MFLHFCATGRLVLLSSSSNSVPNLLQQVVSPKERSQRWSASICVCYVSSSSSTIIVITLTGSLQTGMVSSILVELHKMIGLWCPPYTSFLATELGETSCQAMNTMPRKWSHAYEQHRSIIFFSLFVHLLTTLSSIVMWILALICEPLRCISSHGSFICIWWNVVTR